MVTELQSASGPDRKNFWKTIRQEKVLSGFLLIKGLKIIFITEPIRFRQVFQGYENFLPSAGCPLS